jgi:hypothetical protein
VAREKTMGDDDHPFIVLTETKFSRVTGRRERERERSFIDNQEVTGKHDSLSGNTTSARTGSSI